ncbi:ABC transporter ATP-binding protein [Rhabdonatronobacter sediminivivens]|nr:oligopeptide/dipeptide ABC transporter ATP-binding protein [Rhabdonatronobacter sediminivivens]
MMNFFKLTKATVAAPADPRDRGGPRQPMLIARNLRKHFPITGGLLGRTVASVRAVDDVSFAVRKGETLGVVGESGCGKSTLAKLLMHLVPPDSGELIFDGLEVGARDGLRLRDLRRNMQMVFQDSASSLNPRMPIEESVAYGPRVHGMGRAQARAHAISLLEQVGLPARLFAGRYPHELSGGQKQRVNIARALALDPRMLILDEAVSALDKSVEAQVLNLLRRLKAEFNLTYLFISHDLHVVQYISDRVMVMYLGEVVEIGPVERIYASATHPYTRALLASQLHADPRARVTEPPITGDPPNPVNPPGGCRFHTRCPFAETICSQTAPALTPLPAASEHVVACHMADPASGHTRAGAQARPGLVPSAFADTPGPDRTSKEGVRA